jgi:hypothetical protein
MPRWARVSKLRGLAVGGVGAAFMGLAFHEAKAKGMDNAQALVYAASTIAEGDTVYDIYQAGGNKFDDVVESFVQSTAFQDHLGAINKAVNDDFSGGKNSIAPIWLHSDDHFFHYLERSQKEGGKRLGY